MPIYEYKCLKCSQQFEILQKISDEPLKKCEDCGGEVKKQISAPAFKNPPRSRTHPFLHNGGFDVHLLL